MNAARIALGICTVFVLTAAFVVVWERPGGGPRSKAFAESSTCDPERPHDAGNFDETIVSNTLTREYILHVPALYNGSERMPLVLNLHGGGGLASGQKAYSQLPHKSNKEGFILVMPQAIGGDPPFELRWNATLATGFPDDLTFIGDLLDELESTLCIDSSRIYSTGLSSGAIMSVRLACSLSHRIAAIAPVAGVYWPPVALDNAEPADCPAKARAVPVIAFHGTDDLHFPFLGGVTISGGILRLTVEEAVAEWASNDGCTIGPTDSTAAPGVRLRRYENCDDGAIVELFVIQDADGDGAGAEGGGHTWPGASFDLSQIDPSFGKTTQEISANDLMWDFFEAHPLAGRKAVGGIAEVPEAAGAPLEAKGSSGLDAGVVAGLVATVAAGAVALGGAGWYARRRP